MKTHFNLRTAISFMLICFTTLLAAQETRKASIADLVYADYKKDGIEKALQHYAEVKKKEADKYRIDEFELNRIGYVIMNQDKDLESAEKVFRLNMEEYPRPETLVIRMPITCWWRATLTRLGNTIRNPSTGPRKEKETLPTPASTPLL